MDEISLMPIQERKYMIIRHNQRTEEEEKGMKNMTSGTSMQEVQDMAQNVKR